MNRSITLLPALILLLAVASCGQKNEQVESPGVKIPVKTTDVRQRSVESFERVPGSARAIKTASLEAKVSGRIVSIKANEGSRVKQGDLLIEVDAYDIKARLNQAAATAKQAEKDFQRISALLPAGAATKQEYDAAQARLQVSNAAVDEAKAQLDYSKIGAPFDGVIARKFVDEGDFAQPGKVLLSLEDDQSFRFELDAPESLSRDLGIGQTIEVLASNDQGKIEGKISEISPTADLNSRTQHIKIDLPPIRGLRSGQFGYAFIPSHQDVEIWIPKEAITVRGQLETVLVAKNGLAVLRLIRTGKHSDDGAQVLSGLETGDKLIVKTDSPIGDGSPIEER